MVFSDHGKTQTELDKERHQEYKNLTPEEKNMVKEMGVREAINLIEEVGEKTISDTHSGLRLLIAVRFVANVCLISFIVAKILEPTESAVESRNAK